jgi:hypothetical protein
MVDKPKPASELAARALCRHAGFDPDAEIDGHRMWKSYLPAAEAVLEAIGFSEPETIPVYRMRKVPGGD